MILFKRFIQENLCPLRQCRAGARGFLTADSFLKKIRHSSFLVGHVTKDGSIAGPKVLEHMVDTVLTRGVSAHAYRIIRSIKKPFRTTNEIGVFEMQDKGWKKCSILPLLSGREAAKCCRSVVVSSLEGTRPILWKFSFGERHQFGMPRRTAIGVIITAFLF